VIRDVDGHNVRRSRRPSFLAALDTDKPTLICCRTVIGKGAPNKAGKESAHGAPLGERTRSPPRAKPWAGRTRRSWSRTSGLRGWNANAQGRSLGSRMERRVRAYAGASGARRRVQAPHGGELPADFAANARAYASQAAGRRPSRRHPQGLADGTRGLRSAAAGIDRRQADLAGSNLTNCGRAASRSTPRGRRQLPLLRRARVRHERDHATASRCTAASCPTTPPSSSFSDYARNAVRMAALMKPARSSSTRTTPSAWARTAPRTSRSSMPEPALIPNLDVWRPCDTVETAVAWKPAAIERRDGPSALLLSRQNVPHAPQQTRQVAAIERGGYVLADFGGGRAGELRRDNPAIIATGSEVRSRWRAREARSRRTASPCASCRCPAPSVVRPPGPRLARLGAPARPAARGRRSRRHRFLAQVRRPGGRTSIGIDRFGASAPAEKLYPYFGFTVDKIVEAARKQVGR
jgi:transketolase